MHHLSKLIYFIAVLIFSNQAWSASAQEDLKAKAEGGNSDAQYEYAEQIAWNIPGGEELALEWYEKSAAQGNPYGQIAFANSKLFQIKQGSNEEKEFFDKTCPSIKEIISRLEKQNSPEDAYNLADIYQNGLCVPADQTKALELTRYAAEHGVGKAQLMLARHFRDRGNKEQMLLWYDKAIKSGMDKAEFEVIECYFNGKCVDKDIEKAKKMLTAKAEAGDPIAYLMLGNYYVKGKNGFSKDEAKGRQLINKAANAGIPAAKRLLEKVDKK